MSLGDFNLGISAFNFSFGRQEGSVTGPAGGLGGALSPSGLRGLQGIGFSGGEGGGGLFELPRGAIDIGVQIEREIQAERAGEPSFPPGTTGTEVEFGAPPIGASVPELPIVPGLGFPGTGAGRRFGGDIIPIVTTPPDDDPERRRRGGGGPEEVPRVPCVPIPPDRIPCSLPDLCFRFGFRPQLNLDLILQFVQRLSLFFGVPPGEILRFFGIEIPFGVPVGGRRTSGPPPGSVVTMPPGCPGFFAHERPRSCCPSRCGSCVECCCA